MRVVRLTVALFFLLCAAAYAAATFPALSGRVVDDARILSAATVQTLDRMLADCERATTNQVVVVTVSSLQGLNIEQYGYQLGRAWGIGQKGKNNGALLIVAPHERKVRIEVGYGLEALLTDSASSMIVNGVILPAFRSGAMEEGIVNGTKAMVSVVGGQDLPASLKAQSTTKTITNGLLSSDTGILFVLFLMALFVWTIFAVVALLLALFLRLLSPLLPETTFKECGNVLSKTVRVLVRCTVLFPFVAAILIAVLRILLPTLFTESWLKKAVGVTFGDLFWNGPSGGGSSGGGFSGGGFSGGGGSFGGGGASGSW